MNIREEICNICHKMYSRGWGAFNGNISVELDNGAILVTPTGVSKELMTPEMLVEYPSPSCSTEIKMHLRAYAQRSDIGAVVHAHPPYATAFAVAGKPLDGSKLVEMSLTIGDVPVAPFAEQGTEEVGDSIAPLLAKHDVILLANHGIVAVGANLLEAFAKLETAELCAQTLLLARYARLLG
ncbi:MAG: class II aldolase/adducin family protein [Oscillospiraceae bacterium]|nr:class II aldolase/adducin family protein [Oscillospiraceae bacterium]